jgi:hypothetical protein
MDDLARPLRVLSLGAGVQSTTLALMAAKGEIEQPDCAIFADTGAEPKSVYDHLEKLQTALPFPIHIVTAGNIKDDALKGTNSGGKSRFAAIPYFLDRGKNGIGMGRRQCTKEYKIVPIQKKIRELLGYAPRSRIPADAAEVWIGISTDEAIRMKPSRVAWQKNRWPLIERGISRHKCLDWLNENGWTAPKSACTFCPFRSDESWIHMKATDPAAFQEAVDVDHAIRTLDHTKVLKAIPYIHRSCKPLDQVDLRTAAELGQPDLFNNDCEGMCGV